MRRAGRVVGEAQGIAVVRSEDETHPSIGTDVLNDELTTVGTVVDVFGPVERPYLAVSPDGKRTPVSLLNEMLYVR